LRFREIPHAYDLTVNCLIPPSQVGKTLRVGDAVVVTGRRVDLG
jgi:hypothetical protein